MEDQEFGLYAKLLGNQKLGLYAKLLGNPCLEEIFTGEYSNILRDAENESLQSAWGLIVGSFSSAGDIET